MHAEEAEEGGDEIGTKKNEGRREINLFEWLKYKEGNWERERAISRRSVRGKERKKG